MYVNFLPVVPLSLLCFHWRVGELFQLCWPLEPVADSDNRTVGGSFEEVSGFPASSLSGFLAKLFLLPGEDRIEWSLLIREYVCSLSTHSFYLLEIKIHLSLETWMECVKPVWNRWFKRKSLYQGFRDCMWKSDWAYLSVRATASSRRDLRGDGDDIAERSSRASRRTSFRKDNKVRLYTNDGNLLYYEKNKVRDRFSFWQVWNR